MRARKFFLISLGFIAIIGFFISGVDRVPVEKIAVSSAIGYDIESSTDGTIMYSVPITIYNVEQNINSSQTFITRGKTLAETREDRQRKIDRKYLLGFEKIYVISDTMAKHGIKDMLDILVHSPQVNDTALVCVCKGKAEDIMKMQIEGYPSSADFIEGLIRYSNEYNFYPKNYKLIDVILRVAAEGRSLALPIIEINNNSIEMTGLAVFEKDKMVFETNVQQTKFLNILKENGVSGIVTMEDNTKSYINLYGKSKRKVNCYKVENNYKFIINITVTGDIIANEKYRNIINDTNTENDAEEALSKSLEEKLKLFMQKVKSEYKSDCLELGRIAAAKYGRGTGTDWDNAISNSEIDVKVKVKIDRQGRGDY